MCNLMKVQSSFRFKGSNYRVHFSKRNGQLIPVVEKMICSFLGVKIWKLKQGKTKTVLSSQDVEMFKSSNTMKTITFLRNFAQKSMGHDAQIV